MDLGDGTLHKSPKLAAGDRCYEKSILEIRSQPGKTPSPGPPKLQREPPVSRFLLIIWGFLNRTVTARAPAGSSNSAGLSGHQRCLDSIIAPSKLFWKLSVFLDDGLPDHHFGAKDQHAGKVKWGERQHVDRETRRRHRRRRRFLIKPENSLAQ
jgi:hypothetical protein